MSAGLQHESVFTLEATQLKFGEGAVEELGWEIQRLGLKRIMLVADPVLRDYGVTDRVLAQIESGGATAEIYEDIAVEPTIGSFQKAADFAKGRDFDGFIGLGGGSTMDTAKVSNLIKVHGGEIMDYVNPPIGAGRKPPSPLLPLIAIPTTSGSGSEATTVAILDIPDLKVKTGISHRFMRPLLAIVDPDLARTTPGAVTASAGLDVVCHAAESYISKPFDKRDRPANPGERPPYQGSNPIADIWSMKALEFGGQFLARAVRDGDDLEARGTMMLGATMAGIGFGTAGCHIPHSCAYPIAGLKHAYTPAGYRTNHAFVPHGFSVIVTAPAAFRFTYDAAPEKHIKAAELLTGGPIDNPGPESLPRALTDLMKQVGAPSGIEELGYTEADIPDIIDGALKQQRLLVLAPKPPERGDLEAILKQSLKLW
ncbi:hydroxyacid-oxoacid transhydrogenase [Microbaculum marinum]|uniref:hydroxyacid-oxoacid transhydrogenase n=1 Tax=Microbaculum marinum TaxID=1764581 RepID=A0AAW9RPX5_9HYPH